MTLACGNAISTVKKLSTNCASVQSLLGLLILFPIVAVPTADGEPQGAALQLRPATPSLAFKDAA